MKNIKSKVLRVWIYISLVFVALLLPTVVVMNLQSKEIVSYVSSSLQLQSQVVPSSLLPSFIIFSLTLLVFVVWIFMGLIVLLKGIGFPIFKTCVDDIVKLKEFIPKGGDSHNGKGKS